MSSSCRSMQGPRGTTTDREIEEYSRRPISEGAFYAFRTDRRATRTFALIFDRGDENASALKRFAIEHKISGSSFIAIRARSSAKLGWLSDNSLRARAWISHHVGLRLIDPDAAVVFHKTEFANAIHEEADAWSRSRPAAFPGRVRNQLFRFDWFAKFRHQRENSRRPFVAGVEKPIDEIALDSHTARQRQ